MLLNSELEVLDFWKKKNIFEKSVKKNLIKEPFVFYDGPPFGTGLPHWGHITVSQIKDSLLRYKNQKGYYVPRRWGWDCHGVPIEKLAEKELQIKDKREIENEHGIKKFNQTCRDLVLKYDNEWRKVIERIGRWVDMDDQYRTMDNDYIESTWWGLGQLWEKGLIHKDYRISLYSPKTGVPLSHTDVAMEVKYEEENINTPISRFKVLPSSSRKLIKKILEQIAYSYSEQLRLKNNIEKRLIILEKGSTKKAKYENIMKQGRPEFEGLDWDNFQTDKEISTELKELRSQFELVLENIETLNELKKILNNGYDISLLSWTTTPWTLPANVALAIGSEIEYSMYYLGASNEIVILAENRAIPVLSLKLHEAVINSPEIQEKLKEIEDSSEYFETIGVDIKKIISFKGEDLEGLEYEPLFETNQKIEAYEQKANIYKVYTADFVDDESGTGVVHIAPAYGQDDFELKQIRNLPILTCLNEHGEMRDDLNPELKLTFNKFFLDANPIIIELLQKKNLLFNTINFNHRVPVYDRDGSKVYYCAQESWFIAETKLKTKSLELNEKINWYPETLKYGRFGKGLETAPDWAISRSRYWGNPLPIWQTEDKSRQIFVDSMKKLESLAVNPIYKVLNTRELNPDYYQDGNVVIFTDSYTKLPLGINATQYRSKNLAELRKQKSLDIKIFAQYAQPILEEILERFKKYKTVQILFDSSEQALWTTWLLTLHPDSKKKTEVFYFYQKVKKTEDIESEKIEYKPDGPIQLLDLHRPYIDDIILQDEIGNVYTRIPDVLDTWVDSGSMPFASHHYPFENKEYVEKNTPADWILEGQDQTRGWFRTLHILSTGIFNKPAFKNVNSHGLVLAGDGRKMSKSKKNYTDPGVLLDKFGADAVRNYLMSSTLLDLDSISFKDEDLQTTFRETTLLLANSQKFIEYVFRTNRGKYPTSFSHPLNKWWLFYTQDFVYKVDKYMSEYQPQKASRLIIPYIRDFSTWYIRRSKDLLNEEYGLEVAACLQKTMKMFAISAASLQPFNTEKLWQIVRLEEDPESVHLTDFLLANEITEKQKQLLKEMDILRELVSEIHSVRKENQIRVRQPLYADFEKFTWDSELLDLLKKECNLLDSDLSRKEGEMFEKEGEFGFIKVDLVIDQELAVLGFVRDFERSVQAFRKKQGYRAGQTVAMKWQPINLSEPETFNEVIKKVDWKKLCLEIEWVENLSEETQEKIKIKDLADILVA
jgi:isoleucyl-tRNA synthetase